MSQTNHPRRVNRTVEQFHCFALNTIPTPARWYRFKSDLSIWTSSISDPVLRGYVECLRTQACNSDHDFHQLTSMETHVRNIAARDEGARRRLNLLIR